MWRSEAAKQMPVATGDIREIVDQPVFIPLYKLYVAYGKVGGRSAGVPLCTWVAGVPSCTCTGGCWLRPPVQAVLRRAARWVGWWVVCP